MFVLKSNNIFTILVIFFHSYYSSLVIILLYNVYNKLYSIKYIYNNKFFYYIIILLQNDYTINDIRQNFII